MNIIFNYSLNLIVVSLSIFSYFFFPIHIYIKHLYFREATLIEQTRMIMVPLKIIIADEEKIFYGFGVNKKQAKCAAAKQALKRLQLES